MNDKQNPTTGDHEPSRPKSPEKGSAKVKKPWHAPKVMSQEPLEAVAAACSEIGAFGKSGPPVCGTLGS